MNTVTTVSAQYQFQLLAGIDLDKVPASHRVIRVVFRADSDKAKEVGKKSSMGVIVPALTSADILELLGTAKDAVLYPDMVQWVISGAHKIQEGIARAVLESGSRVLSAQDISINAIAAIITRTVNAERAESVRLSGASITAWYEAHVAPALVQLFSTRMGCEADDVRVLKITRAYGESFQLLAGKGKLKEDVAINLLKAIELATCPDGDVMRDKLLARIEVLTQVVETDLLAAI